MSKPSTALWVVTYHYVRDLPRTRFPRIKGRLVSELDEQAAWLSERCEMATLQSALAFLAGEYEPARDLCLLTFDDGLKDHYTNVLPILARRRIQGLFFISTVCLEQHRVLPVHKNHFLMAELEFGKYRSAFLEHLATLSNETPDPADLEEAKRAYPWDNPDVAAFKFFLNYRISEHLRVRVLDALFEEFLGDESKFARELYLDWEEARQMQSQGMVIGGHSNNHVALSSLSPEEQEMDLATCAQVLHERLAPQAFWPFCYPYGHSYSFDAVTIQHLRALGFMCSFTTVPGAIGAGEDPFTLRRVDTNDVLKKIQPKQVAVPAASER
ncbi:MAG TPA: polysaccharide deacetylase family protein [Verrucomicrobiae bacterium]|nr:polysaccharide deacetylase family protein [Verrucomicrobiae bacterium]